MAETRLSELETANELAANDLALLSQEDSTQESGYISKKATLSTVAQKVVDGLEYSSLETTDKTIVGAINSIKDSAGQSVSYEQTLTEGTKIGAITIDDTTTDILAPSGGGSEVEVTQVLTEGTEVAQISVDGTATSIYAPDGGSSIWLGTLSEYMSLESHTAYKCYIMTDGSFPTPFSSGEWDYSLADITFAGDGTDIITTEITDWHQRDWEILCSASGFNDFYGVGLAVFGMGLETNNRIVFIPRIYNNTRSAVIRLYLNANPANADIDLWNDEQNSDASKQTRYIRLIKRGNAVTIQNKDHADSYTYDFGEFVNDNANPLIIGANGSGTAYKAFTLNLFKFRYL